MEHVIEKQPQLLGEKDPTDPLLALSPLSSWARRGKLAWRVARFQMKCNFTPETTSTNRLLSTAPFFRSHHGAEFGGLSLLRQFARWSCRSPCWVWSLENCAAKIIKGRRTELACNLANSTYHFGAQKHPDQTHQNRSTPVTPRSYAET